MPFQYIARCMYPLEIEEILYDLWCSGNVIDNPLSEAGTYEIGYTPWNFG